jgi:hypothetical protein
MAWGFLSTLLLAFAGFLGLMGGIVPLLWLPLATPVFALLYMQLELDSLRGFERFLAGYGVCLVAIIVCGVFLLSLAS